MPALKARAKTIVELADPAFFLIRSRPFALDASAQKVMKDDTISRLRRLKPALAAATAWTEPALAGLLHGAPDSQAVVTPAPAACWSAW
jgi:glutamyl-tRNA synthetase